MIIVALTGSIATGKTEIAKIFAAKGVPVFDSDAAVHDLYSRGGAAVKKIGSIIPSAIVNDAVDRGILANELLRDATLLKRIEKCVHPLVWDLQSRFLSTTRDANAPFVIIDIPLLFETGQQGKFDRIIVASAPPDVQRARALGRTGMTVEKLELILSRQTPDAQKRQMAHYVVNTSGSLEDTARQIDDIAEHLTAIEEDGNDA
jgi:dephospho-CoA kinase